MFFQELTIFQEGYEQRALVASVLVGLTCGVLGCFIVLRNMALIGDALSHAILPGVVVAFMVAGASLPALFVGAVAAGLIAAVLITWLQRNVRTKQDAAIGVVFSAMFASGVLGISWLTQREGVHLDMKDFLFGNILGVGREDLLLTGFISFYVLLSVAAYYRYFFMTTFESTVARTMGVSAATVHYFLMLLLSFTVVASLHSVGVIMVVGMLVIPASTAYLLADRLPTMLAIAALTGVISAVGGLAIAIGLNTTPGPAMTLVGAFFYFSATLFSPKRGILTQYWRKFLRKRQEKLEDALKALAFLHEKKGSLQENEVCPALKVNPNKLGALLKRMSAAGWVRRKDGEITLTSAGLEVAYKLIRSHRVWETYLARELGQHPDHIHDQAEKFEHLLPDEFIDEVDAFLGEPTRDPHGSLIPRARGDSRLGSVEPGSKLLITTAQTEDDVAPALWRQGLTPNTPLVVTAARPEGIDVRFGDKIFYIDRALADRVRVAIIG